ncbi:MAG: hypothetical protein JW927_02650 [Deltaproteobacteria bacterium]|nr:hypothetical protein [Deltaproteobacteria bacterium]
MGYEIIIYYLKFPSVDIAIELTKMRLKKGGHIVPDKDIRRRFDRSWINFREFYKHLIDSWTVFGSSGEEPKVRDNYYLYPPYIPCSTW